MGSASGWSTGLRSERVCINIQITFLISVLYLNVADFYLTNRRTIRKLSCRSLERYMLTECCCGLKTKKRHQVMQNMVNYSKRKLLGDQC